MAVNFIPQKTNFKFINKRKFTISFTVITLILTVFLLLTRGFNYGIDFTGGILVEIKMEKDISLSEIRGNLPKAASLQKIDDGEALMIRLPLDASKTNEEVVASLKAVLAKNIAGEIEYRKVDYVGPQVGAELIETAIIALLAAFGVLMVYVWVRFEWQYALGALFSLLHDTVLVVGFFLVTQIEFDLTAVAAILTVVGYSINDTVVIYDRIRETLKLNPNQPINDAVDIAVNDTLSRSINTTLTTVLPLISIVLFGGESLKFFALALITGFVAGVYSSIFIASTLLAWWRSRSEGSGFDGDDSDGDRATKDEAINDLSDNDYSEPLDSMPNAL